MAAIETKKAFAIGGSITTFSAKRILIILISLCLKTQAILSNNPITTSGVYSLLIAPSDKLCGLRGLFSNYAKSLVCLLVFEAIALHPTQRRKLYPILKPRISEHKRIVASWFRGWLTFYRYFCFVKILNSTDKITSNFKTYVGKWNLFCKGSEFNR